MNYTFKNDLNRELIEAIKKKLPPDMRLVDFISKNINLGKEASYRRLRGDVEFSFSEVVSIAKGINMSLDDLIGAASMDKAVTDVMFLSGKDPHAEYFAILSKAVDFFKTMKSDEDVTVYMTFNTLPPELIFKYTYLPKLRLLKWLYQNNLPYGNSLDQIEVPDFVREKQLELFDLLNNFRCVYIFEEQLLFSMMKDIKYFSDLGLYSTEEIDYFKDELNSILDDLEKMTLSGVNEKGKPVSVYISRVFFESPHIYIEYGDNYVSALKIYSANTLATQDPFICNTQKRWIQCMKKYSTLISQTGDVDRVNFFRTQREIISKY